MKAYLMLTGAFLAMAFAQISPQLFNQTLLGPSQVANTPQLANQFGFACTSVGPSTVCQVDRSYMLHLLSATAPSPGACADTGGMILTSEPAAYFCVQTVPGAPNLNWIRVAGVNSW